MSYPKKEQNNKKQQNSKPESDKQSDNKSKTKTSGQPSSSGNQSKKTQSSREKSKTEKKFKNNEQKKTDKKPTKPIDSTRQPSVNISEELTKSSDKNNKQKNKKPSKNPKEEVVKPNLQKTDKKTLSPPKDFELTVEKIRKLETSGYKIYEPIGQGSYGKVFKAESNKYGKRLAVKVVDLKRLSDVFKKKFLVVEIELMRKIKEHENVVKFFEIIETTDDHLLYISMELYPNGDLFEYIIKRHFIPERQSCIWFRQLISGVQHIHSSGFAHRDLKCENILLDDKYNIKIIDFGFCCKIRHQKVVIKRGNQIVKSFDEEIPSQTFCGSVIYASPELLKGQPYYPTMTDIWSCGVILYIMLFGRYPNDGTELEVFMSQEKHFIKVAITPKVSEECKLLVESILVDETNRYDIKKIRDNEWFKKQWQPIDPIITTTEYFENLNIVRQTTQEFEYSGAESSLKEESEDNSSLDSPKPQESIDSTQTNT